VVMAAPEANATLALNVTGGQGLLSTPSHLKTTVGALLGTPTYMAPEQCSGLEVDARADIYALAVIAYQMLCGQVPFETETLSQLIQQQIQTAPPSPRVHDGTVPEALAEVVLTGLEKDPARRPPTAGTFAQRLRAASEGELSLIRKSKDTFHSHLNPFMPVLMACLSVTLLGLADMHLAIWAARARLVPQSVLFPLLGCGFFLLMVFAFQLFKAASMLILRHASAQGQFESAKGAVLRKLAAGLGDLLRTQFLSLIDLRPSSWRANILWPVVWAAEGRSGKDAIARSRELTGAVSWATLGLTVRQYAPALLAPLVFPASMGLADSTGGAMRFLRREVLTGSTFGHFTVLYPIFFGIFYINYGAAFSFLYWSALRCRNEAIDDNLPEAPRVDDRKSAGRAVRPATIVWATLPLVLMLVVILRSNV